MDIVERLRGYIAYNTKQSREEDDVMRDAASEIERLRLSLQEQVDECGDPTCEMCIRHQAILETR